MAQDEKTVSSPKPGRFTFIKTDRGLFPAAQLFAYEKASAKERGAESKQLKEEERWMTQYGLVPLPFDAGSLLELQENCSYFDACVRQIAKDVVGQGWELKPAEKGKQMDTEEEKDAFDLLDDPNKDEDSIEDIIERCLIDWGAIGWLALEVGRDKSGKINGLFHLPAQTIRVHKSKNKYCQLRRTKRRWFKRFGYDENEVDMNTGEEAPKINPDRRASELIFYRNYYAQSDYYGAPPILPAVGAVRGLIGVRDYNLAFFENYGVPAALVILEGDWEEGSAKQLNDFLDVEIKRSENAHKTMVAELPSGGKVTWIPLGVEVKEGSFTVYYEGARNEILAVHKMSPYRIGIAEVGALGENVANELTKIYIDSVINPLKKTTAQIISRLILGRGLGLKTVDFEWGKLDTRDLDALTSRWAQLFGMSAVNVNYIRAELGLEKVDHGEQYYISANYMPVGEETIERREKVLEASYARLQGKIDSLIAEAKKAGRRAAK